MISIWNYIWKTVIFLYLIIFHTMILILISISNLIKDNLPNTAEQILPKSLLEGVLGYTLKSTKSFANSSLILLGIKCENSLYLSIVIAFEMSSFIILKRSRILKFLKSKTLPYSACDCPVAFSNLAYSLQSALRTRNYNIAPEHRSYEN